jgi:hypothetical protein
VIKVLSRYGPGGIEENQEKPQAVSVPAVTRKELWPNRVRSITDTRLNVFFLHRRDFMKRRSYMAKLF